LSGRAHGTNGAAPLAISLLNEQLQPEAALMATADLDKVRELSANQHKAR